MKIIITGGAGFIGSAVIRQYISQSPHEILNIDALTYAGDLQSLASVSNDLRYQFKQIDIVDKPALASVFQSYQPDAIMHLAAESHVDRSIDSPANFMQTNIIGTYNLLEVSKTYWSNLPQNRKENFRFHHVSTDEVFGDLGEGECFTETSAYHPSSPYSASKASADHLVRAWHRTYGLPIVISNCSNNYGPFQFPEKLIPLIILNAVQGKSLPIYGDGQQVRDWLYVDDHANALRLVLEKGQIGQTYNIGGGCEKSNIEVVKLICGTLDTLFPRSAFAPHESLITHTQDRLGHDVRYAVDATKISTELGWLPQESFESGMTKTINWYLANLEWCQHVQNASDKLRRY